MDIFFIVVFWCRVGKFIMVKYVVMCFGVNKLLCGSDDILIGGKYLYKCLSKLFKFNLFILL